MIARMAAGLLISLFWCIQTLAAPCEVIVLDDPGHVALKARMDKPSHVDEFISDVIAAGGRVALASRVDLPLASAEFFATVTSNDDTALLIFSPAGAPGTDPLDRVDPDRLYQQVAPAYDGIGKVYMGREIAQVMGHLGATWLERPEREQEERTDLLVELMGVTPDEVIADIGSGTGYFSLRLAPRVPGGKVIAVDIQPEMNELLEQNAQKQNITNVETILGKIDDVNIPADTVDVVLFVDAYHEFSHPWEMKRSLMKALKPGGRIVLVEYRSEDPTVRIKPRHKMTEAQSRKEFESAGFEWIISHDELPQQHVLIFQKPRPQDGPD